MTVIKSCVIVAVDDSPASRVAHRWAASYARATATDLCAVHVLDWPIGLVGSAGEPRTRLYVPARQIDPTYRDRLQRVLDDTDTDTDTDMNAEMDAAGHPHAGSPLHFAQGPVGEVLVRLSTHATLLVIGTRERHQGGQRFVTGSASHYCVSHAMCPVVTVPEPPVDGPARDSTATGEEDVMPRDPELAPSR